MPSSFAPVIMTVATKGRHPHKKRRNKLLSKSTFIVVVFDEDGPEKSLALSVLSY